MYLGGEGGTGNTRVVDALMYFAKMWDRPAAVRTCAPTGIAASLVKGQTFHSLVGLRGSESFRIDRKPSPKSMKDIENVLMLIVDEVSMLSRKNLGALDCFLRRAKEIEEAFGGVLMLFSGDFFQIPPVRAAPVYLDPSVSKQITKMDCSGFELWRSVKIVIILNKSMRHSNDVRYSECLRFIRKGVFREEDVHYLNERVLSKI